MNKLGTFHGSDATADTFVAHDPDRPGGFTPMSGGGEEANRPPVAYDGSACTTHDTVLCDSVQFYDPHPEDTP